MKDRLLDMVFQILKQEPATCIQLETIIGRPHQSISPRLSELVRSGCAKKTGRKFEGQELYALVPGKTLDDHREWSREKRHLREVSNRQEIEKAVLEQCVRTANILKGRADRNQKQRALRTLGREILSLVETERDR